MLTDQLISFWELEEASGTRNDSHGTNHLADNNTVTQVAGKVGNAAQFTAANSEYLSRSSEASLQTGDIDFTFCGWIYFDSVGATYNQIITKGNPGGFDTEFALYLYPNDILYFDVGYGSGLGEVGTVGTFSTGVWIFFVIWHDSVADTLNIQIDDGPVASVAHAAGVQTNSTQFRLGSSANDASFQDGRIDQVGFWKRVLTADERTQLYNSGDGLSYAAASGAAAAGTTSIPEIKPIQGIGKLTGG